MNKQPKRDYSKQIDEAAISLAKKYDMSEDRARAIVTQRLNSLMHEQQQDNRGFLEKMREYIRDTASHPIDRLAQIGISSASTFPGMVDLSSRVYNPSLGEDKAQVFRGEDYLNPNYEQPTEENPREPLNLAGQTKEYLRTQGKKIGLNPEKNEFAEKVNEVPAALLDMVLNRGAGTGIKAAGKAFRDAGKRAEVLGTTGKAAVDQVGKGIERVGNFFRAGTNIKNPIHAGANIGAVVTPNAIPDENRNLLTDLGASLAGAHIGGRIPLSMARNTPEMRAFREQNRDAHRSEAYKIDKEYEKAGVPSYIFNVSDSKPMKLATNLMETSILGNRTREALANQREKVSRGIYNEYDQNFDRSSIAEQAAPYIKAEAEDVRQSFKDRFNKQKQDVEKYTDSKVKLQNTNEYMSNVLKNYSTEPGHVTMFLNSLMGRHLHNFNREALAHMVGNKIKEFEMNMKPGQKASSELKELQKLKARIDSNPKLEEININGVQSKIDPVMRQILESKYLKNEVFLQDPYVKKQIDYLYGHDLLQNFAEGGVFNEYYSPRDKAEVKGLYGNLKKDIKESIIEPMRENNAKAALEMEKNYEDYKNFNKWNKRDLNALMHNIENPLALSQVLVQDAYKKGNKNNLFMARMPKEEYESFLGKINRMYGSPGKNAGAEFSPAVWNRNYKNLDKVTKSYIFGNDRAKYDTFSKVIDNMQKIHKFDNTSMTGVHGKAIVESATYGASLFNAASSLFNGDWKMAIASLTPILAGKGLDIGLTSQTAKKLFIKIKDVQQLNKAVDMIHKLEKLSTNDKVKVVLKNLGKSLSLMDDKDRK